MEQLFPDFLLAICIGITPGKTQENMCGALERTKIGHMQGKHLNPSSISLAPLSGIFLISEGIGTRMGTLRQSVFTSHVKNLIATCSPPPTNKNVGTIIEPPVAPRKWLPVAISEGL